MSSSCGPCPTSSESDTISLRQSNSLRWAQEKTRRVLGIPLRTGVGSLHTRPLCGQMAGEDPGYWRPDWRDSEGYPWAPPEDKGASSLKEAPSKEWRDVLVLDRGTHIAFVDVDVNVGT